ncbi:MAG: cytochrome C [Hyphomicrobiales bacterium]|nr:cytochrome C [Hyphomicrobiales bacterium]
MAQIFHPRANSVAVAILVSIPTIVILVLVVNYQLHASPFTTDVGMHVDQPVPFSHKHHVGDLGLDCRYCHGGVEGAAFAGLPPTHTCMTCHSQLFTNAAMLAPVRKSLANGVPLHWNRVYRLPDYVYFDHSVHIRNGIGCTTCHGDMSKQPLTEKKTPLTMGWCLSCHRDPGVHMRSEAAIFDPHAPDPDNDPHKAVAMLRHYVVETSNMTDCSVCHR